MAAPKTNKSGITRARQIANAGKSGVQRAQALVGKDSPVGGSTPATTATSNGRGEVSPVTPVKLGGPVGCGVPGSGDWGMAAARNAQERRQNPGQNPPFIYVNVQMVDSKGLPYLTVAPCPNPNYIKEIPPRETGGETPLPVKESPIKTEVDKIIVRNDVKIIGESNILNKLPTSSSSLYAKNVFNFISNLYDKENKKININLEDEIIAKTIIK